MGPGLLESVYEEIICYELDKRDILYKRQQDVPVFYDEMQMNIGFRADIIIDNKVIIEVKSVEALAAVHHKQLLTYLKLTDKKVGLLVNFNVPLMKQGIVRLVNNF